MRRKIGLLVIATFFLGACSSSNAAEDPASSDVTITGSSIESSDTDTESGGVDDVVATGIDGKSFSLSESLVTSPVVLWFWAPG